MDQLSPGSANLLSARDAREAIGRGLLSSEELIEACFARIDELEDEIGAWTQLDKALAMEQARAADDIRFRGKPMGALHGLPVGIKDIIDTADYPTERGTVLHQGRRPERDATLVSLLKEAGAVILGKTVSTELAVYAPGKTRNPHNPEHTPGGSSSGSAAAVSAAMVPFAVGTQTNGSVIRPAAYCGVYGFKPSFARISRHGVMTQSPPLDTIGLFARSLDDLAMIADVLMRFDAQDEAMTPVAPPSIATVLAEEVPANPHFAFVRTPAWGQVEAITKDGFRELIILHSYARRPGARSKRSPRTVFANSSKKSMNARKKPSISSICRQPSTSFTRITARSWKPIWRATLPTSTAVARKI
jgi:Asp-tRNA(Asn)/Glu-tRNA(Gln) amidotransferase A subunit family amidase